MKKHARLVLERASALGLSCSLSYQKRGGHMKLKAEKDGVMVEVPISGSPKNDDACANMVIQMLRRRFLERGVVI